MTGSQMGGLPHLRALGLLKGDVFDWIAVILVDLPVQIYDLECFVRIQMLVLKGFKIHCLTVYKFDI